MAALISLCGLLGLNVGFIGSYAAKILRYACGIGAFPAVFVLGLGGLRYMIMRRGIEASRRSVGIAVLFVALLTAWHYVAVPTGKEILPENLPLGGGLLGGGISLLLRRFFGVDGEFIILGVAIASGLLLAINRSLAEIVTAAGEKLTAWQRPRKKARPTVHRANLAEDVTPSAPMRNDTTDSLTDDDVTAEQVESTPCHDSVVTRAAYFYSLPDISQIFAPPQNNSNRDNKAETEDKAQRIIKTLHDFKVSAEIVSACQGPAITRFELAPAPGVKVSKITGLAEELALHLAVSSVRIEPIPDKPYLGVEVPNKELNGVALREVLENEAFATAKSPLTVGLGKDIGGEVVLADLAKMPHLLVAGATGSGKSVCINTIITGILCKASPDEVKFILIDPKMVELSGYNGIPHLMASVITEPSKAAAMLNWAVEEMETRYLAFADAGTRNIETYNDKNTQLKMPYIVIIIDELADLMMVAPQEIESSVCRLAQKARAAGIHLVLATQRPSVDVITGLIKANIPSRISFAVSSQIDSRTILDTGGAEKLLGKGDMLFLPIGAAKPCRVQGAFVSDGEVERLLKFIRAQDVSQGQV